MANSTSSNSRIALFQRTEVRRTLHNNAWWFVIADVVATTLAPVENCRHH